MLILGMLSRLKIAFILLVASISAYSADDDDEINTEEDLYYSYLGTYIGEQCDYDIDGVIPYLKNVGDEMFGQEQNVAIEAEAQKDYQSMIDSDEIDEEMCDYIEEYFDEG